MDTLLIATPNEVAKAIRTKPNEVYRMLEDGELDAYRIGNAWKIPWKAVEKYISERAEEEARNRREMKEASDVTPR